MLIQIIGPYKYSFLCWIRNPVLGLGCFGYGGGVCLMSEELGEIVLGMMGLTLAKSSGMCGYDCCR